MAEIASPRGAREEGGPRQTNLLSVLSNMVLVSRANMSWQSNKGRQQGTLRRSGSAKPSPAAPAAAPAAKTAAAAGAAARDRRRPGGGAARRADALERR